MPASLPSQESKLPGGTQLKICGLRDPLQAGAIAASGVDAIGVVAVPGSPRFLPVDQRPALFAAVQRSQPGCLGVLVVADPADRELPDLHPGKGHQVVQLHGGESPQRCRELRRSLGLEVVLWKALRIRSREDLPRWEAYADVVDALLLDAWVPDQLGGTGRSIPVDWLEGFVPSIPWWLAGGINPETVGAVLEKVNPDGVDASSGVEDRPGVKNLERVNQLIHALKGITTGIPVV
ncbi:MAG: phosphoribosylanthranilate isomerase [Cyanobium sp.]